MNNCKECDSGTIQHTSFISEYNIYHVYGCNRCESGWSKVERPSRKETSSEVVKSRTMIYEVPMNEEIGLGNFFYRVKDRMDELGLTDPQIEFTIIDGKICIVEPDWENES